MRGIDPDEVARDGFTQSNARSHKLITPTKFRACASFAYSFSYVFDDFKRESLCWMTEWGIDSPELEETGTFMWAKLRSGAQRELLNDYPGHLFGPDENLLARTLLVLAMVNVWDCMWFDSTGDAMLFISHDGYMKVHHRGKDADRLISQIAEWGKPR